MHSIYKFLLYSLSALPLNLLYGISDILYFLHKYLIRYRKEIVIENLKNSFPDKSEEELKKTANLFFRNFFDFILESVKGITITQKEIDTRISVGNIEIIQKYNTEKRNVMVLCGHLFNWEWLKGLVAHVPQTSVNGIYSIPKNKLVNDIISQSREKFGGEVISMQEARKIIAEAPQDGSALYLMVADQSPYKKAIRYDLEFMNQTTPVFQGFEKIALKHEMGIVYIDIIKLGRGKFHYNVIDILPQGERFKENEVVHRFFELLEESIHREPQNYMWTHRRWKYKKGIDY